MDEELKGASQLLLLWARHRSKIGPGSSGSAINNNLKDQGSNPMKKRTFLLVIYSLPT